LKDFDLGLLLSYAEDGGIIPTSQQTRILLYGAAIVSRKDVLLVMDIFAQAYILSPEAAVHELAMMPEHNDPP